MTGWVKAGDQPVTFGVNVPPSDEDRLTNAAVEFNVTPIVMAGQRGPFQRHELIGLKNRHWYSAHPGEEYEIVGVYIGGGMVLTANTPGGT